MAAPSLYRRHRPRSFSDVVGQEHVVRTLRNAVAQDKVHHAYLFVGSRGTGKTSMAKILAACLNCEHGPTTEPDGTCESCRAIAEARSLDVIEMDAASNNSVDDIRDLRDRVAYAPVSGRSKVYILDEAHMLSTQAWNAFLKTLEEPPPDTIFVLATTEAQKVLPTVVDRCHRFDFQRPTAAQIAEVVRRTAAAEGIDVPEPAISLIARHATGSFRDALGTLEQLVTYSGPEIALDDVLAVLGVADAELLDAAIEAVAGHDAAGALRAAARPAESGRDLGQFFGDLEAHARDLLIVQTLGEVPRELSLTDERDARLLEQAQRLDRPAVTRLLDLIAEGLEAIKNGADPRTRLELALVKAAAPEVDHSTQALLARLTTLENGGGLSQPPHPSPTLPTPREEEPIAPPEAAPVPQRALDLDALRDVWPAVTDTLRPDKPALAGLLAEARPVAVAGEDLVIAFPSGATFKKRLAEDRANRDALAEAVRTVAGTALRPRYELRDGLEPAAPPPQLSEEEWIARFKAEFDAEEI